MKRTRYEASIPGEPIQPIYDAAKLRPKYARLRTGDFSDSTLSGKLSQLSPNTFVAAPEELRFMVPSDQSTEMTLTSIPDLGRGRHESRTEVQFGQLYMEGAQQSLQSELVSVKYTSVKNAVREFHAARHINKNEELSELGNAAFVPLGFIKSSDGTKTGLISRYQHEVKTLDRTFWSDEEVSQHEIELGLTHAADWLARLHNAGIVHGDAQPKNIAGNANNDNHYPDLETTYETAQDIIKLRDGALKDIETFLTYQLRPLSVNLVREAFIGIYLDQQNIPLVTPSDFDILTKTPLQPVHRFTARS